MLNMIKICIGKMSVFDWILIGLLIAVLIYMCYKNFKGVKQMALSAMREAQIKYLGKTGEERKKKAIEIFKSMPFVKKSLIFKYIPAEKLYNFFESIYQSHKGEIKK